MNDEYLRGFVDGEHANKELKEEIKELKQLLKVRNDDAKDYSKTLEERNTEVKQTIEELQLKDAEGCDLEYVSALTIIDSIFGEKLT